MTVLVTAAIIITTQIAFNLKPFNFETVIFIMLAMISSCHPNLGICPSYS